MGRHRKDIRISVKEFVDMLKFIKSCPINRSRLNLTDDVPIPETGRAYWYSSLEQVIECLMYIDRATPLTSSRRVMHEKKILQYDDDRVAIYEYVRKEIIEKNGGSEKIYEK